MIDGFLHPALAAGVALASVPLLIHLLNRQRHKPLEWGAMRFVLAAYRKTRRRVQLENLLLLLLRMGAVALLALAVARPFVGGGGMLAQLTESRRDVVLVLDGSASTGYTLDVTTVFERVVERASEIVAELDGPQGDRVHVILAGDHPRLVAWPSPDKAAAVLPTLTGPTDERLDLAAALAEVRREAEEDAAGTGESQLEVRLLTDLQRGSFLDPEGGVPPALVEQLDALADLGLRVLVEDLGAPGGDPVNLVLDDLVVVSEGLRPGEPVEVAVGVRGHGGEARPALRVGLTLDGNRLPSQRIDVPADGHAEALFGVRFPDAGPHTLEAEIDGDRLPVDDRRASVVVVPPPVRVLVVDGAPADELVDSEAGFLLLALEAPRGDDAGTPFEVDDVSVAALASGEVDLGRYDVVWLAGVAGLPESTVTALEERVAAGASLVVSCGPRMADLEGLNERLFRADGTGLLPAELVDLVSAARRQSYYRVADFDEEHPILAFFAPDRHRPLLTEVPVYDFLSTVPLPQARVLARLDDDGRSPLLLERDYAEGRVYLWTSSIGKAWTLLPQLAPAMIPLTVEWVRHAGRARAETRDLSPGEGLSVEVRDFPRGVEVLRPDGSRRPLDDEPQETARKTFRLPELSGAETARAGLYRITISGAGDQPFAVQLDPREGDLRRLSLPELEALHPALVPAAGLAEEGGATDATDPRKGELWRFLAAACLLFLVGETLWAAYLGQRRRVRA